jgi:hypothetical protein
MISIRNDQSKNVENGINFYPLNDKYSFGFIFRFGEKLPKTNYREKAFFFRYSKIGKRWHIFITSINKKRQT